MKALWLIVAVLILAVPGFAQEGKMQAKGTMHGYVVDAMCAKGMAKKDNPMDAAAKHTKACALEEGCAASGYGVFSEGKWYKFDAAGDKMAKELIEKTKTEKGIMVEVKGEMKGETLAVSSIIEHKMEAKEEKKSDKN